MSDVRRRRSRDGRRWIFRITIRSGQIAGYQPEVDDVRKVKVVWRYHHTTMVPTIVNRSIVYKAAIWLMKAALFSMPTKSRETRLLIQGMNLSVKLKRK